MNPATLLMIGTGIVLTVVGVQRLLRQPSPVTAPRYVVAIGNSLTADGGYCRSLEQALPVGSMVDCHGWVGQGAKAVNDRVTDRALSQADDVIVLAGVNDLASGRGVDYTIEALERIYQRARRLGARVIAVQLTPWAGHARGRHHYWETEELNNWIRKSPSVEVTVGTGALGDSAGFLLPQYDRGDGLHLSRVGQQRLGELIFEQVYGG